MGYTSPAMIVAELPNVDFLKKSDSPASSDSGFKSCIEFSNNLVELFKELGQANKIKWNSLQEIFIRNAIGEVKTQNGLAHVFCFIREKRNNTLPTKTSYARARNGIEVSLLWQTSPIEEDIKQASDTISKKGLNFSYKDIDELYLVSIESSNRYSNYLQQFI